MRIPLEWLREYVDIKKSPKEIADSFTLLGLMLDKIDGEVLSLEHRMDRSDWLSVLGCARDLAAFEKLNLILPPLHTQKGKAPGKNQIVNIDVECPDKVRRFNTRVFRNIKVKPSPDWLKNRLELYGIPAINNIVDITNYVMVELGQPMHAQDLAKMEKQEIVIRNAKKTDAITTLLGENIELDESMFVLTQNDKPTVIGGIVGGESTGINEKTTDIVLDAGNYDQVNIRKTSRKIKIQNESVLRYDKFLHPKLTEIAIQRTAYLILELAGGEYFENIDWYPDKTPLKELTLRKTRLDKIGGMDIKLSTAKEILDSLGYKIRNESSDQISVEIPYFRTDVEVEDDLVADVLRINSYEKVPSKIISGAPPKEISTPIYAFEDKLRNLCVNLGLHEHITIPLVKKKGVSGEVVLENALSSERNALRTTIRETLLPVVSTYKKHKISDIGLFEIGKVYKDNKEENILEIYHKDPKPILSALLREFGIGWKDFNKIGSISLDSITIKTEKLMNSRGVGNRVVTELKNYSTEDFSFVLKQEQQFGDVYYEIKNFHGKIVNVEVLETRELSKNEKSVHVRITYSTSDTSKIREDLLSKLKKVHNVNLR